MNLELNWELPYKVYDHNIVKWRRVCNIPTQYLRPFFIFWKRNKIPMLAEGYSVTKEKSTNKWFLVETKECKGQFKNFEEPDKPYVEPHPGFVLPEYNVKDISGLRPWQVRAVGKLVSSIKSWNAGLDGSDLGTGKTYTACGVTRELGYDILVVCPKSAKKSWEKVICDHFKLGSKLRGVVNYETLKIGKSDSDIASYVLDRSTRRKQFRWKIPKKTLIVWDESQKLKNWDTKNAKICRSAHQNRFPMLFCSATIATNPLEMRTIGAVLKMFKNTPKAYYEWARNHGVYDGPWGLEFNNDSIALKRLHHIIFDQRGVRLRREEIPNFPECDIISDVYNMDDESEKEINKIYSEMNKELKELQKTEKLDDKKAQSNKKKKNRLIIELRARQQTELIKVPLFVEMAEEALEEGFSVVIFVNFTETLKALSKRLNTTCIYDGKTPDLIKIENVENFQSNKSKIIILNVKSGGPALNLHDLHGNSPRLALISPTHSPVDMRQCLGRVWRDSSKTKATQKIIWVANTVEERVCENVKGKLKNLDILNDGDLSYEKNHENFGY